VQQSESLEAICIHTVMPGLVPGIHVLSHPR